MSSRPLPQGLVPLTLVLSVAGLAIAGYLTIVHYTTTVKLACSSTGVIDCERVTTSAQSMIGGIPVALLGVVFFAVSLVLCLPAAWRSSSQIVRVGRLVWVLGGLVMVLHLLYAELFQIDAICLWCSAVHVITVALLIAILVGEAMTTEAHAGAKAPAPR